MKLLTRFFSILLIGAMLSGSAGCKAGLDKETIAALDKAINAFQPKSWQDSLGSLITQLHGVGYDLADRIAQDVQSLIDDAATQGKLLVGFSGNEAFCGVDFVGSRVEIRLRRIAHAYFPDKFADAQYYPAICNVVPTTVGSDFNEIVTFFGFDFQNFAGNYSVQIREENEAVIKKKVAEFVTQSNYQGTVHLQPSDFDSLDHHKKYVVEITWNDINISNESPNQGKSGLSILFATDTPPPPPPAPGPVAPIVNAPPGLVMDLYHSDANPFPPMTFDTNGLKKLGVPNPIEKRGGDLGSDPGHGLVWWIVPDYGNADFKSWKLPQGVVFGLKHSSNQSNDAEINVFGINPLDEGAANNLAPCFRRVDGGDRGGSSGEGFYWYISTGNCFDDPRYLNQLPFGTVVGLRNSENNANDEQTLVHWGDQVYNSLQDPAPPGFIRVCGPDHPWMLNTGPQFCWFMKITGPSIVYYDAYSKRNTVGFNQMVDQDLPGFNIDKIFFPPDAPPDLCQAYCFGNFDCAAWTFVRAGYRASNSPPECFLKASAPTPAANNCCISGVK